MQKQTVKQFECPAKEVPTDAECDVFMKGEVFCPYAVQPHLAERIMLPSCPHFVWVKR